jgi:hypothetical protein
MKRKASRVSSSDWSSSEEYERLPSKRMSVTLVFSPSRTSKSAMSDSRSSFSLTVTRQL